MHIQLHIAHTHTHTPAHQTTLSLIFSVMMGNVPIGPHLAALFWETIELLGCGAHLEEVEQVLRVRARPNTHSHLCFWAC